MRIMVNVVGLFGCEAPTESRSATPVTLSAQRTRIRSVCHLLSETIDASSHEVHTLRSQPASPPTLAPKLIGDHLPAGDLARVWFSPRAMPVNLRLQGRPFTTNWNGVIFSSSSSEGHVNLYVSPSDSILVRETCLQAWFTGCSVGLASPRAISRPNVTASCSNLHQMIRHP